MEPVLEFMDYFFPDPNKITFNSDGKLKVGFNSVFMNGKNIASFGVKKIGTVKVDPDNLFSSAQLNKAHFTGVEEFPNSILLKESFLISHDLKGGGFERAILKRMFKTNPGINNFFIYAYEWKHDQHFWHRLGGKTIISTKDNESPQGLHFIQIKRHNT